MEHRTGLALTGDGISRREFVARLGLAAGAAMLGCSDASVSPATSGLDHIIIVTMENRSFDHLLGWLPGSDGRQAGLSYLDGAGTSHPTYHLINDFQGCGFTDPDHSFAGGRTAHNGGACDGWLRAGSNDLYTISYYEAADLPFLGRAAPQWTVLDRYFAPFLGPTGPNRLISQTGQTDRLSNTGVITSLPSIWDRLNAAGISGANYGNQIVTASAFGPRLASVIRPIASFYSDAAAGTLPNVSYVDPDFASTYTNTYHPHDDIRNGEEFLAGVYRAVTTGPLWRSSLLLITFDEWGGFYDHVRPPVAPIPPGELAIGNTDGLRGFRVPAVLVSPFARRRNISSALYDHASILRLIEWRWNLEPLTVRDAGANNLADELDFAHPDISAPVYDVPAGPFGGPCP